jgi:hypothetical protein
MGIASLSCVPDEQLETYAARSRKSRRPTQTCCGGKLKVIASIEEPQVTGKILAHLQSTARAPHAAELPLGARAPPAHLRLV